MTGMTTASTIRGTFSDGSASPMVATIAAALAVCNAPPSATRPSCHASRGEGIAAETSGIESHLGKFPHFTEFSDLSLQWHAIIQIEFGRDSNHVCQ
ncbi:hypothetical protein ACIQUB_22945 [Rhizobium sp. NPDC090275]|uniref:hypothetical protein n=1 Tax=Rhizobium sp. NPDC090275 TaxID=3364498 RepID=UPI00383A0156